TASSPSAWSKPRSNRYVVDVLSTSRRSTCPTSTGSSRSEDDDFGADLGEVPHEVGVEVGLALATTGQPGSQFGILLVARSVGDVSRDPVEADVADVGLQPADHVRQERLAVPRCRHLAAAVDLVGARHLVVVLAPGDQPRADDALVLVDGPDALPGAVVHDALAAAGVGRQRRCIGTTGRDERERVAEQVDCARGRWWRVHDQRGFVRPDVEGECRLTTDETVDEEVLLLLQLVDSGERVAVVDTRRRAAEVTRGDQRLLQAGDGSAGVALAQFALVDLAAGVGGERLRRRYVSI